MTDLIAQANGGDGDALNALCAALYREWHAMARARLRRSMPMTVLDTTSLVHESYLKLIKTGELHAVHVARSCRISWAELERFVARLDAVNNPAPPPPPPSRRWRRTTDASGQRSLFAVESSDPEGDPPA